MYSTSDRISEEAYGDIPNFLSEPIFSNELGFDLLSDDPFADISISGSCFLKSPELLMSSVEPNEFINTYLGAPSLLQTLSTENDNKRALINTSPTKTFRTKNKAKSTVIPVPLSESVAVGAPSNINNANQKISIVNALEESFRPRYKSDYFSQNGNSRKPRYVADRQGNHFITLRVPVGVPGKILIHWLTIPDKSGERYIMPYRFQESNVSLDIPDCNPLEVNIEADRNGVMRLYLVLIKAKQDELKTSQPLQMFQPWRDALEMSMKNTPVLLNPKQLIRQYRLDQSQLAFTFCRLSTDGKSFVPEWDTTVLSTVLQELPPESAKSKSVSCPKCKHQFEVSMNNEQEYVQETPKTNKRKVNHIIADKKIKSEVNITNEYPFFVY